MDPYFYLFIRLLSAFVFFFYQNVIETRSHCAILGCNLSKEQQLTLYKTRNVEPNYIDKFFSTFCQELPLQKLGDRHPNTIELASWLMHVLCDFKATWHQEASVSLEYTTKIHLANIFYLFGESSPAHSHNSLGIFIFCYTFY